MRNLPFIGLFAISLTFILDDLTSKRDFDNNWECIKQEVVYKPTKVGGTMMDEQTTQCVLYSKKPQKALKSDFNTRGQVSVSK